VASFKLHIQRNGTRVLENVTPDGKEIEGSDGRLLSPGMKARPFQLINVVLKQKLWSSGRALGSRSEGRGFDPCPMLDGSGVKAMPGSIPTPNFGSL